MYHFQKGSSTLEILIAFAVLLLGITGVIGVSFGNQSVTVDAQTNNEALYKAEKILEDARAASRQDFNSVNPVIFPLDGIYQKDLTVTDLTECKKEVKASINWSTETLRPQKIELSSRLADIKGALAQGGDCASSPPTSNWNNPQRFASDTFNPGKPTAIDAQNGIAYLGADNFPFFYIADTRNAVLNQSGGLFVTFANSFDAGLQINALDAINWRDPISGSNKNYVFAAMDAASNQLKVIDVTDIYNPTAVTRSLSTCVTGSFPEGWRIFYYKNYLYLVTRETAGPELHIFDVTTPSSPSEFGAGACKGFQLNDTVESLTVRDQNIGGMIKRYAYLATDQNNKELRVLDVTDPLNISEVMAANQNLAGNQDGASVYLVGNKLYFGRQSTPSGADLYIYDVSNPPTGLPLVGNPVDIGTGVIGIRVAGRFGFLATPKTNQEFQIWDISNPASITLIRTYNSGNVINHGLDYEPDFIYSTGQSTPNFQILYSP